MASADRRSGVFDRREGAAGRPRPYRRTYSRREVLRGGLAGAAGLAFAACAGSGSTGASDAGEGGAEWGYSGAGGPANWADLSPEYESCGAGGMQSPIDITGYTPGSPPPLRFSYRSEPTELTNDGRAVHVHYPAGSRLEFSGRFYELESGHFHSPAEHTLDGGQFAAELHLVHRRESGDLAVAGFLFREGGPDPRLQLLLDNAPAPGGRAAAPSGLDAGRWVPSDFSFYMYQGSTTTPPCTEPVEWFVMLETGSVSPEQAGRWQELTAGGPTNRPIQPRNGREIIFSGPRS